MLASFVAALIAVVGFYVAIDVFAESVTRKLFAVLGAHAIEGALGVLLLVLGLVGAVRILTGRSTPDATQRQRIGVFAIVVGMAALGGLILTFVISRAS